VKQRKDLSDILHSFCENVYYQPPTGYKLVYPCIIYALDSVDERHADDISYLTHGEYAITYITRDPDDPNIIGICGLPKCRMNRTYTVDNLYHSTYTIYI